jgi:hypothetical protein
MVMDISNTDQVAIYSSVYGNINQPGNQPDGAWILALT